MKKISYQKMADTIIAKRKEKKLTQAQLADMTGIHRAMVSRLEGLDYIPSIDQLQAIAEALASSIPMSFIDNFINAATKISETAYLNPPGILDSKFMFLTRNTSG